MARGIGDNDVGDNWGTIIGVTAKLGNAGHSCLVDDVVDPPVGKGGKEI